MIHLEYQFKTVFRHPAFTHNAAGIVCQNVDTFVTLLSLKKGDEK